MLDLHCHLLPAVDDGASSLEAAVEMARQLVTVGVTAVAPSPHAGSGPGGDVSPGIADEARGRLGEALEREGISLQLLPNAEHHVCQRLFERIDQGQVVPLGGEGNWLLVELPWAPLARVEEVLFRLQAKGYRLLLAHPERTSYLDEATLARLIERGVRTQLELGSWIGVYGRRAMARARRYGDKGMGHVVATDLHRPEAWLGKAKEVFERRYGEEALMEAWSSTPRLLLGQAMVADILPFRRND